MKPGASVILYQALEKTKQEKYQDKIMENLDNLTGIEKVKCLAIYYLITRDEEYLTQAYELVIPIEDLSKGDSLDYIIWEVTDFHPERYPTTSTFREYGNKKLQKILIKGGCG